MRVRPSTSPRWSKKSATAGREAGGRTSARRKPGVPTTMTVFLDTSVLLAGLIDLGPQSVAPHLLLHAVAERTVTPAATAWHCCLEFFSVATRLPAEFRLAPADA